MLELGYGDSDAHFDRSYRIYISGDTVYNDDLKSIPERYPASASDPYPVDLMLIHLGGTTIPSPQVPLLMVTMDGEQGMKLLRLINPRMTIPIHYDDYEVFMSPLKDFAALVEEANDLRGRVTYLDRGDAYKFGVRPETHRVRQ